VFFISFEKGFKKIKAKVTKMEFVCVF